MVRLLESAAQLGVLNSTALARALHTTDGTVGNWASRGVSRSGAMTAQSVFGVCAAWVISGKGEQWQDGGPKPVAQAPAPPQTGIAADIAGLSVQAVELALFFDDLTAAMTRSERAILYADVISAIRNHSSPPRQVSPVDARAPERAAAPIAAPAVTGGPGKRCA